MIEIKESSRELTALDKYAMTKTAVSVKNLEDNVTIMAEAYMIYQDINEETGETKDLTAILDQDGRAYITQSSTFTREMLAIWDIFGESSIKPLMKKSGTTKSGRPFVTCVMDIEAYKGLTV